MRFIADRERRRGHRSDLELRVTDAEADGASAKDADRPVFHPNSDWRTVAVANINALWPEGNDSAVPSGRERWTANFTVIAVA
jgi:hypothetical protein